MKILYVSTVISTVNAFLIPHIELLISKGNEVDVAANIMSGASPNLTKLGCKIYDIEFQRSPLKKDNYIAYKKIKKLVSEGEYDLVHVHTPVASFVTRLACRNIPNLKVLYTAHGFHFFKGAPLKNWLIYYPVEKLAARWTDGIITINKEDLNLAQKMPIRKGGKAYLIPGVGVNLDKFKPITNKQKKQLRKEYGFKEDDFLLIYAAELNKNKNQAFLIKGIAILKERYPNIKLLLAGDGNLKEQYVEYVESLNMQKNIIFLGFRNDLNKLIPICDLGVSASIREGLGVNVIEYLSCGLPVVASNNRGHNEIIKNGINGYLFTQGNMFEFVNLVERIYIDSIIRKQLSQNAPISVQKFSYENSNKSMEYIYSFFN